MLGRPSRPTRSFLDVEQIERTSWRERRPAASTYDLILASAASHGDRIALRSVDDTALDVTTSVLTFTQLAHAVTQFANLLARRGCGPADAVTILLPTVAEYHVAFWGAEAAAIASPLNPLLEVSQLEAIMRSTASQWLVTAAPDLDDAIAKKAAELRARIPTLRTIVVGAGELEGDAELAFDELRREPDSRLLRERPPASDAIASYFATGGTTGAPKIARHTHDNEIYCAWGIVATLGLDASDVLLCGLPLFHVNALMLTGLGPFLAGAETVLLGRRGYRTPGVIDGFFDLARHHRATVFSAVPTIYGEILDRARSEPAGTSLRFGICGAAPISVRLFTEFQRRTGIRIIEGYGLTEGTCVTSLNPPGGESRVGSVGIRLPYQELAVVDQDGAACAPGTVGRLLMRGPQVFPGYLSTEAASTDEGYLDTGDLARIDGDGYVWLAGRSKDLIIRGGHNIDPALAEGVLTQHPATRQAAVVGRLDERVGEVPVAFVTLKPGVSATPSELLAHCLARVPERAAAPLSVEVVEALPTTAVGKIFKPALRALAANAALRAKVASLGWGAQVGVRVGDGHGTSGLVVDLAFAGPAAASPTRRAVEEALGRFAITVGLVTYEQGPSNGYTAESETR